jgi:hypothetical protein
MSATLCKRAVPIRGWAAALLIAGAPLISGCSSGAMLADHLPTGVGGLPEGAPQRPAAAPAYPAVHDMPPQRTNTRLSEDEQKKLEADLIAARNRLGSAPAKRKPAAGEPKNP